MKSARAILGIIIVIVALSFVIGWVGMIATELIGNIFDITTFQYMSFWEVYILMWTYEIVGAAIITGAHYVWK